MFVGVSRVQQIVIAEFSSSCHLWNWYGCVHLGWPMCLQKWSYR